MDHRDLDHLQRRINRQVNQTLQSVLGSISNAGSGTPREKAERFATEDSFGGGTGSSGESPEHQGEPSASAAEKARAAYVKSKYAKYTKYLDHTKPQPAYTPSWKPPTNRPNTRYQVLKKAGAGSGSGLAMQIVGLTGALSLGISWMISALVLLLGGDFATLMVTTTVLLPLAALSACLWGAGTMIRKRALRFRRYVEAIGDEKVYTVKRLSASTGIAAATVRQDLPKMLQRGLFPEAYLDDEVTCIMLDQDTFQQYLRLMEQQKQLGPQEEPGRKKSLKDTGDESAPASAKATDIPPEVRRMIQEGLRYVEQIREVNDALPGVEISNRLYQLEDIIRKIFHYVEQHPDKSQEIRKLMEYHLPTTLKLVNTYRELETQALGGSSSNMKEEILAALDVVNKAFVNLLDNLCQDMVLDVSSDITVLKTMLAQEGLMQNGDFQ